MSSNNSWSVILKKLDGISKDSEEYRTIIISDIIPKVFSFLKDDYNVISVETPEILNQVYLEEHRIFGSESNHCDVQYYTSGSQMLYDAITSESSNLIDVLPVNAKFKVSDIIPAVQSFAAFPTITKMVMGQFDLLNVTKTITPELRICLENVRSCATRHHLDYTDLLSYVTIHEEIHNWQATQYPLDETRRNLIRIGDRTTIECFMTSLEGHAEFFSNEMSKTLLPSFEFNRIPPGFLTKLKYDLLGITRQQKRYIEGEKFIRYLYGVGGVELANMPLSIIPTELDIKYPDLYAEMVIDHE